MKEFDRYREFLCVVEDAQASGNEWHVETLCISRWEKIDPLCTTPGHILRVVITPKEPEAPLEPKASIGSKERAVIEEFLEAVGNRDVGLLGWDRKQKGYNWTTQQSVDRLRELMAEARKEDAEDTQ